MPKVQEQFNGRRLSVQQILPENLHTNGGKMDPKLNATPYIKISSKWTADLTAFVTFSDNRRNAEGLAVAWGRGGGCDCQRVTRKTLGKCGASSLHQGQHPGHEDVPASPKMLWGGKEQVGALRVIPRE